MGHVQSNCFQFDFTILNKSFYYESVGEGGTDAITKTRAISAGGCCLTEWKSYYFSANNRLHAIRMVSEFLQACQAFA